jgi:hypothetical protein
LTGNTDLALALALEADQNANASSQAHVMLARAAYAPGTMRRIQYADLVSSCGMSPRERSCAA